MKKSIFKLITAGLLLGSMSIGPARAADRYRPTGRAPNDYRHSQSARHDLGTRTKDINRSANSPEMRQAALHNISVETGVPLDRVRAMHERHSDAGVAGIMNACVMADETKRSPEFFLKEHLNGKSWALLARDYNVPLGKLDTRLDHLQNELTPAGRMPRGGYNH